MNNEYPEEKLQPPRIGCPRGLEPLSYLDEVMVSYQKGRNEEIHKNLHGPNLPSNFL